MKRISLNRYKIAALIACLCSFNLFAAPRPKPSLASRVLPEPFATQFTPEKIRTTLKTVSAKYKSSADQSALLAEGLAAAEAVISSSPAPAFSGGKPWGDTLPKTSPDLKEAMVMVSLLPKVSVIDTRTSWTNPDTRLFAKEKRRSLTTSDDPLAAALTTYATAWGISSGICNTGIDAFRLATIQGWLKLQDRVNAEGRIQTDASIELNLAGALLLAGSTVLPYSEVYSDPPEYVASEAYVSDVAYQREILENPPELTREAILSAMRRTTEFQMGSLWNVAAVDTKSPDRSWVRGVFFAGMIPAYLATGDPYYRDLAEKLTEKTKAQPGPHALGGPDDLAICQTYLDLYFLSPDHALIQPTIDVADKTLSLSNLRNPSMSFVDQFFMSASVWGGLSRATEEPQYAEYGRKMWQVLRKKYFVEEVGLVVRDGTWMPQSNGLRLCEQNGQPIIWGRGMGWVFGGMAKFMNSLSAEDRLEFKADYQRMAEALLQGQHSDGLWGVSILDPETFPLGESSATALISYGYLWGVRNGLLDQETYLPPAKKAVRALVALIEENGKLGYVQPGAESARIPVWRSYNKEYATGGFLLACAELLQILDNPSAAGQKNSHSLSGEKMADPNVKISQPAEDRAYLVGILTKTARPVLENIAADTFFETLPNREWENNRRLAAYTEGLARTLAGISPWLALPEDSTAEGKLRAEFAELARNALITATNPKNKNYRHFTLNGNGRGSNRQLLVETAFIAHALVRAQNVLWDPLTKEQRANVRALLDIAGKLEPIDNSNWLLFASMVEAARWELFGEMDRKRLEHGVNKFVGEFYLGDGTYGDGKHFRWDYYNSFVIHPMLVEVLRVAKSKGDPLGRHYKRAVQRMTRYADIQERLISPEGTYPLMGRSQPYRYSAFQTLSMAMLMGVMPKDTDPAGARDGLTAVIRRMSEAPGTYDDKGWLDIGAVGRQLKMRDVYTGTGSLYLTLCGMLHLGIPADDPFWTAPSAPWTQKRLWNGEDVPKDLPAGF